MKIVIFSGGSGTRMWPLSRKSMPKQFQKIIGETSFMQDMVNIILSAFDPKDVFILTGRNYVELVKKQVPNILESNIIGEPEMRDTLAAVSFAAAYLDKKFPGETMAALWGADQIVREKGTLIRALKAAEKLSKKENVIAKVDVHPTFPNIHLGYLEIGEKVQEIDGFDVYEFIRHVEKPDHQTAEKFLESGNYLWNTGYFVWPLKKIMELFKKHTPETYHSLVKIQKALGTEDENEVIEREYQKIPKMMIDHALFEKLEKKDQLEIPAVLGWTDVGAWNVLKDELADSTEMNVVKGEHIDIDSVDCLIHETNEGKIIATVGLESMVVIDTPDALLICPKARSQDVKKIVQQLKDSEKQRYL